MNVFFSGLFYNIAVFASEAQSLSCGDGFISERLAADGPSSFRHKSRDLYNTLSDAYQGMYLYANVTTGFFV